MPLSKDGSSFYLIIPNKCKYFLYILVAIVAIVAYRCIAYFSHVPFNKSPDPLTALQPLSYDYNQDKVILITGANTGIGKETAKILSLTGATVVIGSRSLKRGEIAKNDIIESNKNITDRKLNLDVMKLDLSSIASIDAFVAKFKQKYNSLDILVCNAAVNPLEPDLQTDDGLEVAFGVNHIAHFHLVNELRPLLTQHKYSRIIVVTAIPYEVPSNNEIFDIHDLNKYDYWDAYMMSKMENIMFTREFAKRYPNDASTNYLHIVSLHPGVGPTDIWNLRDKQQDIVVPNNQIMVSIVNTLFAYLGDSVSQLSYTQLYLALTDIKNIKNGAHYRNDQVQHVHGGVADNATLCEQLWTKSEQIIREIQKKNA
mmetsp:Transcript_35227/g.56523  ORF Transcript_35227/g.56523 Transcript_35227/m.56523 type:complete len:370 (+) Transcript_35227:23-1132(+)|eukprot:CAMPEP_0197078408 /NCGR_PEP_ID=MMETSP1384-20130603/213105_1 /TAXON_ID=29189 /ORGANISM="Ammonia sp." /LENGTH=369 /DNA_ID=CAMNT_0042517275 /DNA_START=21 /DNA_END=1130 /DNA_ORIENTATION=+